MGELTRFGRSVQRKTQLQHVHPQKAVHERAPGVGFYVLIKWLVVH